MNSERVKKEGVGRAGGVWECGQNTHRSRRKGNNTQGMCGK